MAADGGEGPRWLAGLELFLTPAEKDAFAEWRDADDAGASPGTPLGRALAPVLEQVAVCVPENVAPSLLYLAGALVAAEAWHFAATYAVAAPAISAFVCAASLAAFWILGEVGRLHGQRLMLDTPVGELFGHACGSAAAVFLVAALCGVLGGVGAEAQWCAVQAVQLGLACWQYGALERSDRHAALPAELAMGSAVLVLTLGACGWRPLSALASMEVLPHTFLFAVLVVVGVHVLLAPAEKHSRSRAVLLATLGLRGVGCLTRAAVAQAAQGSASEAVCDGLILTVVSSDLALAKMAGRQLHPAVAVASAAVVLPHMPWLTLALALLYHGAVFADLTSYLRLPLLGVCRNVYCDGIYDLCHIGHKNHFRRSARLGGRLLVGVVGDKDANSYKRPPVMSAAEREAEVAGCKGVTKVISNAPCFGLTEEFIRRHRIHVVSYGQEYQDRFPNPDDDPYYRVPRKLGIAVPLPRTASFSTSELIQRIQDISAADLQKRSPT